MDALGKPGSWIGSWVEIPVLNWSKIRLLRVGPRPRGALSEHLRKVQHAAEPRRPAAEAVVDRPSLSHRQDLKSGRGIICAVDTTRALPLARAPRMVATCERAMMEPHGAASVAVVHWQEELARERDRARLQQEQHEREVKNLRTKLEAFTTACAAAGQPGLDVQALADEDLARKLAQELPAQEAEEQLRQDEELARKLQDDEDEKRGAYICIRAGIGLGIAEPDLRVVYIVPHGAADHCRGFFDVGDCVVGVDSASVVGLGLREVSVGTFVSRCVLLLLLLLVVSSCQFLCALSTVIGTLRA